MVIEPLQVTPEPVTVAARPAMVTVGAVAGVWSETNERVTRSPGFAKVGVGLLETKLALDILGTTA